MALSSDAITYAADRMSLVRNLLADLPAKYSKPGDTWQEIVRDLPDVMVVRAASI